ncbi:MAG: hypothetical protein SGJ10_13555 [Bacteroidota bacterium]|nr:hypothetical protein [Bacteroidota bacterium]
MLNRATIFFLFVLMVSSAMGQTGLTVGYHYGHANPKEVNRVIHAYNLRNETILTKNMPAIHGFRGFSIGFQGKTGRNSGIDLM